MISFFFKRKKIVVDAFTDHSSAYEHFQIKKSTSFMPDWWKSLPIAEGYTLEDFSQKTNMRHCTGMIDIYRFCFILPLWSELRVVFDPKGQAGVTWQFADKRSNAGMHNEWQRGSFMPDSDYVHLKIISPWLLKSKESLVWAAFQPTYNFQSPKDTIVLPGMLDFQWNPSVNTQLMISRLDDRAGSVSFQPGDPLMAMVPITEREVEFRHHHVSPSEMARIQKWPVKFNGDGMHARKLAKCPVAHGGQP